MEGAGGWGGGAQHLSDPRPHPASMMSLYNYHRTHHRNCYPANGVYVGFHRDIYHVSSPFLRGGGGVRSLKCCSMYSTG